MFLKMKEKRRRFQVDFSPRQRRGEKFPFVGLYSDFGPDGDNKKKESKKRQVSATPEIDTTLTSSKAVCVQSGMRVNGDLQG